MMESVNQGATLRQEPTALYRWSVLLFISLAMFGNYYVYDSIAPVAKLMKEQLGFSDTNIGLLMGIYSVPNVVMVLIGGVIIDWIGTKKSSLLFSVLCMVGAVVTSFGGGQLWLMALGRLVFGLGAESLIVAITTVLAKWFKGKELSLAFGINLTVARLGSFAADNSPTWAQRYFDSYQYPLMIASAFGVISVLAVIFYILMDNKARSYFQMGAEQKQERIKFSEIFKFNKSFWYITLLCVTFYSAIFPFRTFAIKFFQEQHGLPIQAAGFANSIIILATMIGTPLFGMYIDRHGKRASLMILGSLLIVPVYLGMVYTQIHPLFFTAVMGVAFSLVPAAMWPSVALIVAEKKLGTGYGLMTMIQNIGLAGFNFLVGWANDISTDAAGVTDYRLGMWLFSITGVLGLFFAIQLRRQERGPNKFGLEKGIKD